MTHRGESQDPSEAKTLLSLLTTSVINAGTWNDRTMWKTGRLTDTATTMKRHKLELLGVSGTYWKQSWQKINFKRAVIVFWSRRKFHTHKELHLCCPKKHSECYLVLCTNH
ncbi:unnamed protein product [Schistosoma haematobium]|nr:unnamed protein product [Schistosoma haematobium]CAH8610655.1 unnamed protein product [Schistosoma haematobium]